MTRTSSFRRRLAVTAFALSAVTLIAAAPFVAADLTGKWTFSTVTQDRTSTSIVTLKQTGDTLSGTIEVEQMGSRAIVGTVKGDTMRFSFSIDIQGNAMQVNTSGIVKDKDTIEGQLELASMGSFPFTAKRQQ